MLGDNGYNRTAWMLLEDFVLANQDKFQAETWIDCPDKFDLWLEEKKNEHKELMYDCYRNYIDLND